jgi:hypothetical protein
MVSLAFCQQPKPHLLDLGADDDNNSLRDTAIWYPYPPPPNLNLHEDFLVSSYMYKSGYRPLFWTRFGGPGGIYLANLVKISIIRVLRRMDFVFNCPGVPTGCQSFGRIHIDDPDSSEESEDEDDKPIEFLIDGPGGESIQKVEICQELFETDWVDGDGYLVWLKVPPSLPLSKDKLFGK